MSKPVLVKAITAYPGTFDPVTRGHEALLKRAAAMFDTVIMAVAAEPQKETLFSLDERVEMCRIIAAEYENVQVMPVPGLLADFLKHNSCNLVVRGMRTVGDFEYEMHLADINRRLAGRETVFLTPPNEYIHVFSSLVRELARLGGNVDHYVKPAIAARLLAKFGSKAAAPDQ